MRANWSALYPSEGYSINISENSTLPHCHSKEHLSSMIWLKAARVRTDMEREVRGDGENLVHMYVLRMCVYVLSLCVQILACVTCTERLLDVRCA